MSAPRLPTRPTIVCLCGSTRFKDAFVEANLRETLLGNIVLTIGCDMRTDDEIFGSMPESVKRNAKRLLDALHLEKIRLADAVLILNVGGYIGESTTREAWFAFYLNKKVRWLEAGEHAAEAILKISDFAMRVHAEPDELLEFAGVPRGTQL